MRTDTRTTTVPKQTDVQTTTTTTKQFTGHGARFGTDPSELFVELRAGSPAYIRLSVGDYLQEGDAFHREQLHVTSPTLETWKVVEVTPETVRGCDIESGEEREWERADVEKGLAVGRYSTNLTDFERVSVYQVGQWEAFDADHDDSGISYRGHPYVAVVAYGNNGLKYGRRYRLVAPESDELTLWKQDQPRGGFAPETLKKLDARIIGALEAEGYTLVEN